MMKNIYNYYDFINEDSKNDPIPELSQVKERLGVIMMGLPGSGKSTFINKTLIPRIRNVKVFSTDDISFKFTSDPNKYYPGSSALGIRYLKNYMKSGQNFIYDTTGSTDEYVFEITKEALNYNYNIIFILILVDLETARRQNINRGKSGGHLVDDDYIKFVYDTQYKNIKNYLDIHHKSFYIVFNKEGKYKYYKFDNGELKRRKVDKYISLH